MAVSNTKNDDNNVNADSYMERLKDALKGNPPKAGSGGKGNMTKDQILAITNPAERQRLIAENMELFQ